MTPTCTVCAGSRTVRCGDCNGVGKLETEWARQLKSSPVDRLRFEYEKRQRSIQLLETRFAERNSVADDFSEKMNTPDDDEAVMYGDCYLKVLDQIGDLQKEIGAAEAEMTEIQQVLDTKWR